MIRQLADKIKIADGMIERINCSNLRLKSKSASFISSRPSTPAEGDMIAALILVAIVKDEDWKYGQSAIVRDYNMDFAAA